MLSPRCGNVLVFYGSCSQSHASLSISRKPCWRWLYHLFCLVFGHITFRSYWQSLAMCFAALKNAESSSSSSSGLLLSLTRVVILPGTVELGRPDGNVFGPTQTSLPPRLWKKIELTTEEQDRKGQTGKTEMMRQYYALGRTIETTVYEKHQSDTAPPRGNETMKCVFFRTTMTRKGLSRNERVFFFGQWWQGRGCWEGGGGWHEPWMTQLPTKETVGMMQWIHM